MPHVANNMLEYMKRTEALPSLAEPLKKYILKTSDGGDYYVANQPGRPKSRPHPFTTYPPE